MSTATATIKKQFNNIGSTLQKYVDDTKKKYGPRIQFEMFTGKELVYPGVDGTNVKQTFYPSAIGIPGRDRIIDPDSKRAVDIAVIVDWDENDNPRYGQKIVTKEDFGKFTLDTENPNDLLWIDFLLMANFNKSNKYRNKTIEPLLGIVDADEKGEEEFAKMEMEAQAIVISTGMSKQRHEELGAAMGWEYKTYGELKGKIANLAKSSPEYFVSLTQGGEMDFRATLTKAIKRGVANYDPEQGELSWPDGTVFATLDKAANKTIQEKYADWVRSHPKGMETNTNIEKQLAKK